MLTHLEIQKLSTFLSDVGSKVISELTHSAFIQKLPEGLIKSRILDYSLRGGKHLRPGIMFAACGAVGGNPDTVLPVAVATEMFHTWTLVHDDIIDRDECRRGGLTMHARILKDFKNCAHLPPNVSCEHLSHSMALLIGDAQHGMVVDMMAHAGITGKIPPDLILFLIAQLEGEVLPALLTGEVSDVLQSNEHLSHIAIDEIELMLRRKTGALLVFSVYAGAMIGLQSTDFSHPAIAALREYGDNLGLAFQMRDDILGIIGEAETLGKPIGSDFREGKRTLAVKYAYDHASSDNQIRLENLLGKADMSESEVDEIKRLVLENGGVSHVENLARTLIDTSLRALNQISDSPFRDILRSIAEYTIHRHK